MQRNRYICTKNQYSGVSVDTVYSLRDKAPTRFSFLLKSWTGKTWGHKICRKQSLTESVISQGLVIKFILPVYFNILMSGLMLASIDSWNMQSPYLLMNKLCYRNKALLILWSGKNGMTRIKTKFNKVFTASLWLTYPFFWYMTPRQWVIFFRRSGTISFSQNFANRRIQTITFNGHYDTKRKNKHIA